VMPKDARLVARILSLWDHGSFWTQFITGGDDKVYNQKMPAKKIRRPKPCQQHPAAPAPHYRVKAASKRPNAASNMTGGKGPQVGDKLAARAARKQ
jgi:hypothetical protein